MANISYCRYFTGLTYRLMSRFCRVSFYHVFMALNVRPASNWPILLRSMSALSLIGWTPCIPDVDPLPCQQSVYSVNIFPMSSRCLANVHFFTTEQRPLAVLRRKCDKSGFLDRYFWKSSLSKSSWLGTEDGAFARLITGQWLHLLGPETMYLSLSIYPCVAELFFRNSPQISVKNESAPPPTLNQF